MRKLVVIIQNEQNNGLRGVASRKGRRTTAVGKRYFILVIKILTIGKYSGHR
jgi:hypothetical protein